VGLDHGGDISPMQAFLLGLSGSPSSHPSATYAYVESSDEDLQALVGGL
jgi:hypothetical protein